jgi:serine/threonine protein kinase
MSPEQTEGRSLDRRSDIFALGTVLHETISGHRLFSGESPAETVLQILTKVPPPLHRVRAGVPESLSAIVAHCRAASRSGPTRASRLQKRSRLHCATSSVSGVPLSASSTSVPRRDSPLARKRGSSALLRRSVYWLLSCSSHGGPHGTGAPERFQWNPPQALPSRLRFRQHCNHLFRRRTLHLRCPRVQAHGRPLRLFVQPPLPLVPRHGASRRRNPRVRSAGFRFRSCKLLPAATNATTTR